VKQATPARRTLQSQVPADVLTVEALDAGLDGNGIELGIDHATSQSGSTFNLQLRRTSDGRTERYENLSLNSTDSRYVLDQVNGVSRLVTLTRLAQAAELDALAAGTSRSGELPDVATLLDANHNTFRVSVNGLPPVD